MIWLRPNIGLCENITIKQRISEENKLGPVYKNILKDTESYHTKNSNFSQELAKIREFMKILVNCSGFQIGNKNIEDFCKKGLVLGKS